MAFTLLKPKGLQTHRIFVNLAKCSKETSINIVNNKSVSFHFLGDRDYVDVSSINNKVMEAISPIAISDITDYKLKIIKKIKYGGRLYLNSERCEIPSLSQIRFSFVKDEQKYSGYVLPSTEEVSIRFPEPPPDGSIIFNKDLSRIFLQKAYNPNLIFNLMKMGKKIIVENKFGNNPRVASFNFKEIPGPQSFEKISMGFTNLEKYNFFRLNCFLSSEYFGSVIVKVNS